VPATPRPLAPPVAAAPVPPPHRLVGTADEFRRVLAETESAPLVGLDTETTGLDPHRDRLRTVQLATAEAAWVVDVPAAGDLGPLSSWLAARAAAGRATALHSARFDLQMLRAALGGAPLQAVACNDLLLWSLVLGCGLPEEGGHGLSALAARWLGLALPKEERRGDWSGPLRPAQVAYAARDAWVLVPLWTALRQGAGGRRGLCAEGLWPVAAVEDACVPAVADMEYAGIGFDLAHFGALTEALRAECREAAGEVRRLLGGARPGRPVPLSLFGGEAQAPLNLNSPAQVLAELRAAGLSVTSTAEAALRAHAGHPAVLALLRYKRGAKLLSAFGEALPRFVHPRTGRIHARYQQLNQSGIGRFSCSNPNMQQIPHDPAFRRAFVAPEGRRLVIADLNQIELRVMCRLSGDARMLQAYRDGLDLHRLTAALLTGLPPERVTREQRQLAKAANFGLIYAMSAGGLRAYAASSYGVQLSPDEAESLRRRFFDAYPGLLAFHRRQDTEARHAREVRTLLGRCRRWPDVRMGLPELTNCPTQGTGADILKRAMGLLRPALLRAGADLVACVHDELVVECPAARAEEVREEVRGALVAAGRELLDPVPVEAEAAVGASWADKP
jgi:DNA polymerase-1